MGASRGSIDGMRIFTSDLQDLTMSRGVNDSSLYNPLGSGVYRINIAKPMPVDGAGAACVTQSIRAAMHQTPGVVTLWGLI